MNPMLKYVSLIVMLAALIWTWRLSQSEAEVSLNVHASLQREVEDIIRNYIQQHRPGATNVEFYELFTETINPSKVKAHFKYSFDDTVNSKDATHQMFEGTAVLNKEAKSQDDKSTWSLDEVNATNTSIDYKKGSEVQLGQSPGTTEEDPD
jgi:hypothetical protein